MICERVSIHGVLRPLEPKSEIPALTLPLHRLGRINEGVARRYLIGQDLWAKKFSKTAKKIELKRRKNLELARSETLRTVENIAQLQEHLFGEHDAEVGSHSSKGTTIPQLWTKALRDNADAERNSWTWAWALEP
ncbi:hypothetical protein JB92DRAFT_2997135 [Gautieria morchelliformis]|nr:hypothetical protein JB92DRAFT_2997135 [Gautieria morchelliformis]